MRDICRDWGEKASRDTLRLRVETLNILSLPLFLSLSFSLTYSPTPIDSMAGTNPDFVVFVHTVTLEHSDLSL